jgi:hypothetical protein
MNTKHIHHIYPHSPFPCAQPTSTGTHPWKRFIFPSCPPFSYSYSSSSFVFIFFLVLKLELRAFTLSHSSRPIFVKGVFEIESRRTISPGWLQTIILWSLPPE